MKQQKSIFQNNSQLANALTSLKVEFLLPEQDEIEELHFDPEDLISGLSCSNEARLRLALIPLFLQHPQFAVFVPSVIDKIPHNAQITLQCYYCAAVLLQQKYRRRLETLFGSQPALPALFFPELGLQIKDDAETNLTALEREHQILTGRLINWHGTYEHAAQRLLRHWEREKV